MNKITNKFDQKKYEKYWQWRSKDNVVIKKRISNLSEFAKCIKKFNMRYWLYNRTLLFAYKVNILSPDNYDQVGVWYKEMKDNENFIIELNKIGFFIVKNNKSEMWLLRNNRITIVKFFSIYNSKTEIDGYKVDINYFIHLNEVDINEIIFKIPNNTSNLLEKIYSPNIYDRVLRSIRAILNGNFELQGSIRSILFMILDNMPRQKIIIQKYIYILKYRKLPNSFYYIKKLSLEEFCKLEIDYDDFNWIMRKKHLDIISNRGEYKSIDQIIDYIKRDGVIDEIQGMIQETPLDQKFSEPIHWSRKFWGTGNNYFIYPILYGFRKNVLSYNRAHQYIMKNNKTNLYSNKYYQSLPIMNDNEIEKMLKKYPLEIIGKGFSSGRHRACAMIGRIIRGEKYFPVYATILPDSKKAQL